MKPKTKTITWTVALAVGTFLALLAATPDFPAKAQPEQAGPRAPIEVSGNVALSSFMTLGDGYLQKLADCLTLFAATAEARSCTWDLIRAPLGAVAERNVSALVWFALPDGTYWSVQQGQSTGNLSDRAYFQRVLAGETVIGPLVVSKSTGKSVAIVAVPVRDETGAVTGVLGASVYLDELSQRLKDEMALDAGTIFYSFDATPLLALEWDPSLIFVDPLSLGPVVRDAFNYMLSRNEGTVSYRFRNQWRTVIFRQSQVTGWWYALGVVQGRAAAAE